MSYRAAAGFPFEPTAGPLWPTARIAFGWAVATAIEVGKVHNTAAVAVDNPNNTEFLSASDEDSELQRRGVMVEVRVNGAPI